MRVLRVAAAAAVVTAAAAGDPCELAYENGHVLVGGERWLEVGKPCVRVGGAEWCAPDAQGGALFAGVNGKPGSSALGDYTEHSHVFQVEAKARWGVALRQYAQAGALEFRQHYLDTFQDTAAPGKTAAESGTNGMSSWFPSFKVRGGASDAPPLGALRLNGLMAGGNGFKIEAWDDKMLNLNGLESGPLALFSDKCALVLSASAAFMSSSNLYLRDRNELGFGVMGSVTSVPAGHQMATLVSASSIAGRPDGIRRAVMDWGRKLRLQYRTVRPRDVTTEYLQFSTDNGAYYYYFTGGAPTYQEAMIEIHKGLQEASIPVRQWLMDSWWYYKGAGEGVKRWEAMPSVFPEGISKIRDETGWEVVAHNRYWSSDTDYARQNGGDYDFIIEGDKALPLEQRFWEDLFLQAKQWGLTVYEQDWLNVQFLSMNATLQSVSVARDWLLRMGRAAEIHNVNIQYCMSLPRHVLQSLETPAVTQVRASEDYQPGNNQWIPLGITSMFTHALGLAPTKDNFWSNSTASWKNRYSGHAEPASVAHAVVSTYSTGPVAPSDEIGSLDRTLIMRSCAANGKLLRPDVPAVRTDATILAEAGLSVASEQRGQVWITHATLSRVTYTYFLAAGGPEFTLDAGDVIASEGTSADQLIAWYLGEPFAALPLPLAVAKTSAADVRVVAVAPVLFNGWALLGEATTKWVPVSNDRFRDLDVNSDGFSVRVSGAAGEEVQIVVRTPAGSFVHGNCALPETGVAVFKTSTLNCKPSERTSNDGPLLVAA